MASTLWGCAAASCKTARPPHAVTNGYSFAEAQMLDDVRGIVRIGCDGIRPGWLIALAMPAQIHRNNPVPPDEVIGLRREERAITCPPMHEDKGGLAGAAILKGQLDALVHNRRHASFSPFSRALTQPSLEGRCHRERSEAISSRLLRRCAPRNDGLFRDHRITQFTLHLLGTAVIVKGWVSSRGGDGAGRPKIGAGAGSGRAPRPRMSAIEIRIFAII